MISKEIYYQVCMPPEAKYQPQTVVDAINSMPYTVGTAIARGDVSLGDFSPRQ